MEWIIATFARELCFSKVRCLLRLFSSLGRDCHSFDHFGSIQLCTHFWLCAIYCDSGCSDGECITYEGCNCALPLLGLQWRWQDRFEISRDEFILKLMKFQGLLTVPGPLVFLGLSLVVSLVMWSQPRASCILKHTLWISFPPQICISKFALFFFKKFPWIFKASVFRKCI